MLRLLHHGETRHPGRRYVQTLLDEFFTDGPNGRHLYLVSEAAGCSVAKSTEASTKHVFPIRTARAVAAQAKMGLAYVHSCGVTHGGMWVTQFQQVLLSGLINYYLSDLTPSSILFQIPNFDSWTTDEVYKKFGEPQKVPNERVDNGPLGPEVPLYSIYRANMVIPAHQVKCNKIRISDFGEAFLSDNPPKTLHTRMLWLPPENFFHEKIGPAADIWTLAVTIYEILGERPLFEMFYPNEDELLGEMVSTLGKLPNRWRHQRQNRPYYFLEDGSSSPESSGHISVSTRPLIQRLWDMARGETPEQCELSREEMESLKELLAATFRYEPSE